MKPHDDLHEQDLIEHYREHSPGEPSAALDARILSAAHAALKTSEGRLPSRPTFWQRLMAPSGLAAVAGVACVGLALSLTWRSGLLDRGDPDAGYAPQAMPPMASPAPMAPAALEKAAEPAKRKAEAFFAAKKQQANEAVNQRRLAGGATGSLAEEVPAPASAQPLADAAPAPAVVAAEAASLADVATEDDWHEQLLRLRELRAGGQRQEADALLAELRERYPQRDVEAALKALP